jgi:hypothetical protein
MGLFAFLLLGIDFLIVLFCLRLFNPADLDWMAITIQGIAITIASWVLGVVLFILGGIVGGSDAGALGMSFLGLFLGVSAGHVFGIWRGRRRLKKQTHQHVNVFKPEKQTQVDQQIKQAMAMLEDHDPDMRIKAVAELKDTHDLRMITLLSRALEDTDARVRKEAAKALRNVGIAVPTITFGQNPGSSWRQNGLSAVDVSTPIGVMPEFILKEIIIHADTCNMDQMEAFMTYTFPFLDKHLLKQRVTVRIEGNPQKFCSSLYKFFNRCKAVDVWIETVTFGAVPLNHTAPETTWQNPDLKEWMLPLRRLQQVLIDSATCDPILLERFLTYGMEYLGRDHLKRLDVHIYGNLNALHPNLRNNLTNLCQNITSHQPLVNGGI